MVRCAHLVLFRNTGPLNPNEQKALRAARFRTKQKFLLTYRTYSDRDLPADSPKFDQAVETCAGQAVALGDGFGFRSWNEMVDVHLAYAPDPTKEEGSTEAKAERAIGLLGAMVRRYRELAGTTSTRKQ